MFMHLPFLLCSALGCGFRDVGFGESLLYAATARSKACKIREGTRTGFGRPVIINHRRRLCQSME